MDILQLSLQDTKRATNFYEHFTNVNTINEVSRVTTMVIAKVDAAVLSVPASLANADVIVDTVSVHTATANGFVVGKTSVRVGGVVLKKAGVVSPFCAVE